MGKNKIKKISTHLKNHVLTKLFPKKKKKHTLFINEIYVNVEL